MDHLLKTFTQTTLMTQTQQKDEKHRSVLFKYVKTKDSVKELMCHIIGVLALLAKQFKASVLSKILKKDLDDLKGYFREVGLSYDPITNDHTGQADFLVKHTAGHGFAVNKQSASS